MKYVANKDRGVTLVEVIIGVAILGIMVVSAALVLAQFVRSATEAKEKTIALYLAESGVEYLKQIRSEDWTNISNLSVDTNYYFDISTTTVTTSVSPEVIDGYYERDFILTELYRDANDDITASTSPGAVVDTGAYYATINVNYGSSTVELSSILTNIHDE